MAGGAVDRLRVAGGGAVALAIVGGAKMRSALQHLSRDRRVRHGRVQAFPLRAAPWVGGDAAASLRLALDARLGVPVGRPFPDIADHVVEIEAVRRIAFDGRGPFIAVLKRVAIGEGALPIIGQHLATGRELVTPGIFAVIEAAPGRKFPFRLGRQKLPRPFGVGFRIGEGDVHDRMVLQPRYACVRPVGMTPIGAEAERPPLAVIHEVDRTPRPLEQQGACIGHGGVHAGIVTGIGRYLSQRAISGRFDKAREIGVGDRRFIDPERIDAHLARGRFLGIEIVRSHAESPAGNVAHARPHRAA